MPDAAVPDVIVVGAGLAGLVATYELTRAGRRVLVLDQENRANLGGQAFWSLGGLFMVDTPEQRRLGIKDSVELARHDWLSTAQFDREREDHWPRQWADAFVRFAADQVPRLRARARAADHPDGRLGRARRRAGAPGTATRCRASTSPGARGPRSCGSSPSRCSRPSAAAWSSSGSGTRSTTCSSSDGAVVGARGSVLERERRRARRAVVAGRPGRVRGARAGRGGHVGRHRRQPRDRAQELAGRAARPGAGDDDHRRARVRRRPDAGDHRGRGRQHRQPRPHVALRRGPAQLGPDLARPRHPDHPRAVVAVVRRHRAAAAGAVLPGFRHAQHAARDPVDSGYDYSWFVLTQTIIEKEFALSGSEQNPDVTGKDLRLLLKSRASKGAPGPVEAFKEHGVDFVVRRHPARARRRHERDRPRSHAWLTTPSSARSSRATASWTTSTPRTCS